MMDQTWESYKERLGQAVREYRETEHQPLGQVPGAVAAYQEQSPGTAPVNGTQTLAPRTESESRDCRPVCEPSSPPRIGQRTLSPLPMPGTPRVFTEGRGNPIGQCACVSSPWLTQAHCPNPAQYWIEVTDKPMEVMLCGDCVAEVRVAYPKYIVSMRSYRDDWEDTFAHNRARMAAWTNEETAQ